LSGVDFVTVFVLKGRGDGLFHGAGLGFIASFFGAAFVGAAEDGSVRVGLGGEAAGAVEEIGEFITGNEIVGAGVVDFPCYDDGVVGDFFETLIDADRIAVIDGNVGEVGEIFVDVLAGGFVVVVGGCDFDVGRVGFEGEAAGDGDDAVEGCAFGNGVGAFAADGTAHEDAALGEEGAEVGIGDEGCVFFVICGAVGDGFEASIEVGVEEVADLGVGEEVDDVAVLQGFVIVAVEDEFEGEVLEFEGELEAVPAFDYADEGVDVGAEEFVGGDEVAQGFVLGTGMEAGAAGVADELDSAGAFFFAFGDHENRAITEDGGEGFENLGDFFGAGGGDGKLHEAVLAGRKGAAGELEHIVEGDIASLAVGAVKHALEGGAELEDTGAFDFAGDCYGGADGGNDEAVTVLQGEVDVGGAVDEQGVEVYDVGAALAHQFDLTQGAGFFDAAGLGEGVEDGVEGGHGFAARMLDVTNDEDADLADGGEGHEGAGVVEVCGGGLNGVADFTDGTARGGNGREVANQEVAVGFDAIGGAVVALAGEGDGELIAGAEDEIILDGARGRCGVDAVWVCCLRRVLRGAEHVVAELFELIYHAAGVEVFESRGRCQGLGFW